MKFSCSVQQLLYGLQLVNRAIGGEQTLPILQNVLITAEGKRCTLSATNLELSIITSFEVNIENEGGVTVPAKALLHFIQYNQDPEVLLETSEGTQLKLQSKQTKAVISGEATSNYPTITPIQRETIFSLLSSPLLHALNLITFTCAKTSTRPVISGVFTRLEKKHLVLVGTDSYRLSEYRIPIGDVQGEVSCIIPSKFLEELKVVLAGRKGENGKREGKKGEEVGVNMSSQQIEVTIGSSRLFSRLIDGKFPDYRQVIPKEKNTVVTVTTKDLLTTVRRMHYFAKEMNNTIIFTVTREGLQLATKATQLGRDESVLSAKVEGKENKIALSSHYLIDFLSRIDSDQLHMELSDRVHPAVFLLPGSGEFLHLIMPLRLAEE